MDTIPRSGVLLKHNNEFLWIFQNESKYWGPPKGKINPSETLKQCAERELFEETGIKISISDKDKCFTFNRGESVHSYYLKIVDEKPEVKIDNDEIINYKWMNIKTLSKENISFFTKLIVKNLKQRVYRERVKKKYKEELKGDIFLDKIKNLYEDMQIVSKQDRSNCEMELKF